MRRIGLTVIKRLFCSSNPKKSHTFSQLELKQLIQQPNELRDIMIQQIQQRGQLKVSDYWKMALTDQKFGYYRQENVFSKEGDFTTSPQISSLFGEMVATWLVVFMQTPTVKVIDPLTNTVQKKFRLVELGGGRGLLMQDILRSFHSYQISNNFDLCFIEISDYNRKEQQKAVMDEFKKNKTFFRFDFQNATPYRQEFISENEAKNINLRWFSKLEDLLKEDYQAKKAGKEIPFTIFVMNQFFDALPVTILQYTQSGWREKILSLSDNPEFPFQLINSVHELHQKLTPQNPKSTVGDRIEISPESFITMDMMAKMVKYSGGGILNIDYGGQGPFVDSIRAIKSHKYIPAPYYWQVPGICDLSAHVSFSSLAQYAQKIDGIKAFQLIPQQFFLQAMGIGARLEMLSKNAKKQKIERLEGQAKRLTSPEEMGQFYKVQIIALKQYGQIYPHITINQNEF